jgi:tetratricopeptide (TPR) repeat protein
VIRLAPAWISGYIKRGYAYLGKKDFDRAIADFNETIRLQPDFAPLYDNRGTAYEATGDLVRANADFAEAKRLEREMDKRSR